MAKSVMAGLWALSLAFACPASATEADLPPAPILLWMDGAPGSEGKSAAETVRLHSARRAYCFERPSPFHHTLFSIQRNRHGRGCHRRTGGGHRELWMDHEGYRVGRWLSDHGIAAFVLKYRLSKENGSTYTIEGNSLPDVQRAVRLVRSHASDWNIGADRIGVIGFSAGGELAALAATRFFGGEQTSADPD